MAAEKQEEFVFYSDKLNYKTALGAKGKEYFVEGYISTGDLDLVNDIVTKSCMDSMLNQFDNRTIKMDFEHEAFRGSNPIDSEAAKTRIPLGKAITKSQDSKGVLVKWKMNPSWKKFDQKGNVVMTFKDIWDNVEEGMYDAFSIAYVPTRTKSLDREGKSVRLLDDVNLLNVALTGNAINPQATMTAVMAKSLEFMKSVEGEVENMEQIEIKNSIGKIEAGIQELKHKYIKRTGSSGHYQYTYPDDNKRKESGKKPQGDGAGGLSEDTLEEIEHDIGVIFDIKNPKVTSVTDGKDGKKIIKITSPDGDMTAVLQRDGKLDGPDGIIKDPQGRPFIYETGTGKKPGKESGSKKQEVETFVESTLLNDEDSSDKELVSHFMKEGSMSKEEAEFYVAQRDRALKEDLNFELKPYKSEKKSAEELFKRATELNLSVGMADRFIKSSLSGQKADKEIMGCKPMVKTKDEVPDEDAKTPPTPEGEGSEASEAEGEAGAEASAESGEPEGKSMTLKELKSVVETLTKDVDSLKKENADLKAIVEKPLHKAKGAEQKSQGQEQPEMVGPLDMV